MQDYAAAFTNFSGAFPNTLAINASGPSTTDGTEFVANMINDSMWGVMQMILNRAGLTPNGVVESDAASQIREALQKGFGAPPGVVTQWHLASDPGVTGHRCLLLNGQGILRANYADLDAAVYVGDANNAAVHAGGGFYYRADDAAGTIPNIVGVYLILPETRGYAPRGLDVAASVDPDGASRFLGDIQLDASQGWQAGVVQDASGARNYWMQSGARDVSATGAALANHTISDLVTTGQGVVSGVYPQDDGTNGTPRIATETRITNYSTKWVVWY